MERKRSRERLAEFIGARLERWELPPWGANTFYKEF